MLLRPLAQLNPNAARLKLISGLGGGGTLSLVAKHSTEAPSMTQLTPISIVETNLDAIATHVGRVAVFVDA
jgi:hypothetical protein